MERRQRRGAAVLAQLVNEGAVPELRAAFRSRESPAGRVHPDEIPASIHWSREDMADLATIAAADSLGRIYFSEILELADSMLAVESMKQELASAHASAATREMAHPASTRWLDPIAATGRSAPPPPSDFQRTYNALAEAQSVDYRRYDALGEGGVPALRDYRADSPLLASAAAADRKQEPDEPDEGDEEEYEFPTWWFVVIASINVPNQLFATCLWSIVWPVAIANMFGYANKAVALSLADTVNVFVGFANPFVGSLSDRLPERYARRWGRRRPFVFIGTATSGFGVWMTYYAVR